MMLWALAVVPPIKLLLFGGSWLRALPGAFGAGLGIGALVAWRLRPRTPMPARSHSR